MYKVYKQYNTTIHTYEFSPNRERLAVEIGVPKKLETINKLAKPKANEEVAAIINWNVFDFVKSFDGYGEIEQDGVQIQKPITAFPSMSFKDGKLVYGDLPKSQVGVGIAITLIINGKINIINTAKMTTGKDARTAIGQISNNGNIIFVVAEGDDTKGIGITTKELAEFMLSLKCTNAFQGDSGGSSSMIINESYVYNQNRAIAAGLVVYRKKIKASQIIEWCKKQIGFGYVYGAINVTCTIPLLEAKEKQYGELMGNGYYQLNGDYTKGRCAKWLNKIVNDCSGLIKTGRNQLGSVYKDISAQGTYDQCTKRGEIKSMPLTPGCTVYMYSPSKKRMGHVGIYIGNGKVIEARGVDYGIVMTNLSQRAWQYWGLLNWLDYDLKTEKGKATTGSDSDAGDATTPKVDDKIKKKVIADSLNVRTSASVLSKALGQLKKDTVVEVYRVTNGFAEIVYNGTKAYVSDKYLKNV